MKPKQLIAAVLAVMLVCLTACGTAPKEEKTRITFMHGWGGSGADHVEMRAIFDDFARQNPDIELVYDSCPDVSVVIDKANKMLAVDEMPDLISTNGHTSFLRNAKIKQSMLDFSPYLAADPAFAASVSPIVLDRWTEENGAIYTLPDAVEVMGYWYNEDVFRAAGLTDTGDSTGTVVLPETWDAFWQACTAIEAVREQTGAVPMLMQFDQLQLLLGARLAAKDNVSRLYMQGKAAACDEADVRESVLELERAISYYSGELLNKADAREMFLSGQSAIYFNGVWANTEQGKTANGQNIKYAAFPSETGERISYLSPPCGYVINNACTEAEKQACVRFVTYMLSEPAQRRMVQKTRQAPQNPNLQPEWIQSEAPVLGDALNICYSADVKIISLYTVLDYKQSARLADALQGLLLGADATDAIVSILTAAP